jgi:hypothetical protein
MMKISSIPATRYARIETLPPDLPPPTVPAGGEPWPVEQLPFTVRLVHDSQDLDKAVDIRHRAYARHLPDFAQKLKVPEREDTESGVTVLLAESKLDGSPLGSMRIQTNQFSPLAVEQSIELPDWMRGKRLAEATRLGVTDGKGGRLVTTVLFKSYYLYCKQIGVSWMVVTGRSPIDRQYDRLLYQDVFPGVGFIPLRHVGNIPHRVMCTETASCEQRWMAAKHPLFEFAFRTYHPDIQVAERRRALLDSKLGNAPARMPGRYSM